MTDQTLEQQYGDDFAFRNELAKDLDKWKSLVSTKADIEKKRADMLAQFDKEHEAELSHIKWLEDYFEELYNRLRSHAEMGTMNSERRRYMGGIVQTTVRRRPKILDAVKLLEWAEQHPLTRVIPHGRVGKAAMVAWLQQFKPELLDVDLDQAAALALTPEYVMKLDPEQLPPSNAVVTEFYPTLPSMDTFAKVMAMIDIEVTVDDRSEH